jgi:hypothetical protein
VILNNHPSIIITIVGHRLLMYIRRGLDHAGSPLTEYPVEPRDLSVNVCDSRVDSATIPGAQNVHSCTLTCSQTYHTHSHGTSVLIISDSSYCHGRPKCPPRA